MIQFNSIDTFPNVWFSSDPHFGHQNICRGVSTWDRSDPNSTRDFENLEQMNQALVDGINNNVGEDDLLITGGDWAFGGAANIAKFRDQLNVKAIYSTYGNHDHAMLKNRALSPFQVLDHILYLKYRGKNMVVCHYPMISHHQHHHGAWMLHGHVHGSTNEGIPGKILDVGVDVAKKLLGEYRPFSFQEIKQYMDKREIAYASHHSKNTN